MIALGSPAVGLSGFRDTHHQALQAQRLVHVAGAGAGPVTAYDDQWVRAAAILGADLEQTRMLVRSTLGSAIGPRAQPIHGRQAAGYLPGGRTAWPGSCPGSTRRLRTAAPHDRRFRAQLGGVERVLPGVAREPPSSSPLQQVFRRAP